MNGGCFEVKIDNFVNFRLILMFEVSNYSKLKINRGLFYYIFRFEVNLRF